ncbi:uncharacterized protein [Amphiura filiformis]|uniref:uncharacterized protein isoform X2 n=1 Tax=Amphiura filiformis TaxID=82378 RepID=UPI003B221DC1
MYPQRAQTIEYRNPDELPVLYAVPAPRYPGLINIVNIPPSPPFPAQAGGDRQYLTVASDGSVIGVQHTMGHIDQDRSRRCGSCTSDYDNLLRPNHLPQYNHTCNLYPPLPPPPVLPSLKDLYPNGTDSSLMSFATRPNSEIFSRCPPVRASELNTSMQHSINKATTNRLDLGIPPTLPPFARNNSSTHACSHQTTRAPTAITTPSQYYSSTHQQWSWKRTSNHIISQRVGSTEHMDVQSPLFDPTNTRIPMSPEPRAVPIVSVKRPLYKPDARQQIAAMLNARRESQERDAFNLYQPCKKQPVNERIDAAMRGSTNMLETSDVTLTTRQISLPNKRAKRSRKSRPFRIQVVAPIHTSEPLDLTESPTKTKNQTDKPFEHSIERVIIAENLKVTNTDAPLNLSETPAKRHREELSKLKENFVDAPIDILKREFTKNLTSPVIMEQEFPPNIHRMTPIETTEALDLSTNKCKKNDKLNGSDLSPPSLEKITPSNNEVALDLSLNRSVHKINTANKTLVSVSNSSDSNASKEIDHGFQLGLPRIERVFTLNAEAVKMSLLESGNKSLSISLSDLNVNSISNTTSITGTTILDSSSSPVPEQKDLPDIPVSRKASGEEDTLKSDTISRHSSSLPPNKPVKQRNGVDEITTSASDASSPTEVHSEAAEPSTAVMQSNKCHLNKESPALTEYQYCKTILTPASDSNLSTEVDAKSSTKVNEKPDADKDGVATADSNANDSNLSTEVTAKSTTKDNETPDAYKDGVATAASDANDTKVSMEVNAESTTKHNETPDAGKDGVPSAASNANDANVSTNVDAESTTKENETPDADKDGVATAASDANETKVSMEVNSESTTTDNEKSDADKDGVATAASDANDSKVSTEIDTESTTNDNEKLHAQKSGLACTKPSTDDSIPKCDISVPESDIVTDVASLITSPLAEKISSKQTHQVEAKDKEDNKSNISSRPKRACKSLSFKNREGICRHGCIGCNSVMKRFVSKPTKKPSKRKTTSDENCNGSSKVFVSNEVNNLSVAKLNGCKLLSYPKPQTQPMDLSKPSKKIPNDFSIKQGKLVTSKPKRNLLLIKMKTGKPKKIKHLLGLQESKSKKVKHMLNMDDDKSRKIKSLIKLENGKPKKIGHVIKMKTDKPKKIKNFVKVENKNSVESENVLSLPSTEAVKSVVLGGKAPILRLQKLTQRDVVDLSGSTKHSKSSHPIVSSSSECAKIQNEKEDNDESQDIEVERIVNGQKIEMDDESESSEAGVDSQTPEEPLSNFEQDLLQLTTGFDD